MLGEQLLIKMWETLIKEGIGSLASPWQIKRQGRAHAEVRKEELLLLAQAEVDAQAIREGKKRLTQDFKIVDSQHSENHFLIEYQDERKEPSLAIEHMSERHASAKAAAELQEEINLNKTIILAEQLITNSDSAPPQEEIGADWLTRWRDSARKVRSEELQQLWAQALAGELKSPGSYSLRTFDFLRNISKSEAEMISRLAPFVTKGVIYRDPLLDASGINFSFLLEMEDIGVVSGIKGGGLEQTLKSISAEKFQSVIVSGSKVLIIEDPTTEKQLKMDCYKLSSIGAEVLSLGNFPKNIEHLKNIGTQIKLKGFSVKFADWVQGADGGGHYFNAVEL